MTEQTWKKIIRSKGFSFWRIPAFFLWLSSFVYRIGFALKKMSTGEKVRVGVPILSVGNIVVGGSGKTPLVEFIARDLINEGIRVGIVSSGYGRPELVSFVEPGYKVQRMDVAQTGDEVKLLAHSLPDAVFSVDESKTAAAQALAGEDLVDIIIIDDGFQHFKLHRDINLVTYDAGVKRKLYKSFPYGILREPVRAIRRADIVVITRVAFAKDIHRLSKRLKKIHPKAQFFKARFEPTHLIGAEREMPVKYLEDKSVFLFGGVGNFRALRKQVTALSADLDYALELSDHQEYDRETLGRIKALADEHESDVIVTTSKDWVKLANFDFGREIYYLEIQVDLDPGEEKFIRYVLEKLSLKKQES